MSHLYSDLSCRLFSSFLRSSIKPVNLLTLRDSRITERGT